MKFATGAPRSPSIASAQPNTTANSSTCSTSPVAKALTTVVGISFIRKSTVPPPVSLLALSAYALIAFASSVFGSTFMPTPGWKTKASTRPSPSAMVVTTSK